MALPYAPDEQSVLLAISRVGPSFRTLDIARHPVVLARNRGLASELTYNSGFGQYLRANAGKLGIQFVSANTSTARFRKVGPQSEPEPLLPEPNAAVERPYSKHDHYRAGDAISHETFGHGRVLEDLGGNKVLVVFSTFGERRLIHGVA